MPKVASPAVRGQLIDKAAEMLRRREPVTLKTLLEGTGASTMSIYTHFGGMGGLWSAVRHEGFVRLAAVLAQVEATRDPVRNLVALGAAYQVNAATNPGLYRVMFDQDIELADPAVASTSFEVLVAAAAAARSAGRFGARTDPAAVATRYWAIGHGLGSLVGSGVMDAGSLDDHVPALSEALFVAAGDEPARCRRSVRAGWRTFATLMDGSTLDHHGGAGPQGDVG